jgi:hypothetical protein
MFTLLVLTAKQVLKIQICATLGDKFDTVSIEVVQIRKLGPNCADYLSKHV